MKQQTRHQHNMAARQVYGRGRHIGGYADETGRAFEVPQADNLPVDVTDKKAADKLRAERAQEADRIAAIASGTEVIADGKARCADCGGVFRAKKDGSPYAHNCSS